ncbi:FKBP-type peptidyl-prolyl cis-trans isomerase, partial [Xylanibacter rarus]|uniref:FKBP-type peptidyl-prolyl cis-trans isomerase n=1 Tax=Xylanibacter rarus TaxID=1676614 RepID=UPI003FD8DA89
AANKTMEGVVSLPSGLQYKVLVKCNGEITSVDDEVTVKYEGRLIDGTVFDSSYKRPGETAKFRPNQVIKGWTEALTMMPVGSKWELYIPQNLAYGDRKAGAINPYSTLIFTVEMVSVEKAKKPETEAAAKGADSKKTAAKTAAKKTAKTKK